MNAVQTGITVPMAIVDFIPVVMFFVATVILQKDLFNKMSKGAFALLAAGSIMVFLGGFYKALWKMLYALNICDFVSLDASFFPMQGPGFLLVFLGLTTLGKKRFGPISRNSDTSDADTSDSTSSGIGTGTALAVAPAVYKSNLIFIVMQVVGFGGIQYCMVRLSLFLKKKLPIALFILSFIFSLGMGYLGAKFDETSAMHWLAQLTNILSQGCFLWGALILHHAGLAQAKP